MENDYAYLIPKTISLSNSKNKNSNENKEFLSNFNSIKDVLKFEENERNEVIKINQKISHRNKEIKEFILSKLNNCYLKYNNNRILLQEKKYPLFILDFNSKKFIYDYFKIFDVISDKKENYDTNEIRINKVMKDILINNLHYKDFTPKIRPYRVAINHKMVYVDGLNKEVKI
jgi:hypothetical protein